MDANFKIKFLLYLREKNSDHGFSQWGCFILLIMSGLLAAAISLPSLLGCQNKAKQAEAKNYTGVVNRSQQAYYLEYQHFATSISQLQVGIHSQTNNYKYYIKTRNGIAYAYGVSLKDTKSYVGAVYTTPGNERTSEALTLAIACETNSPTQNEPANPKIVYGVPTCGDNTTNVTR